MEIKKKGKGNLMWGRVRLHQVGLLCLNHFDVSLIDITNLIIMKK